MIVVKVNYENEKISKVVVSGHARYDEYGKDIVCSAVSTCVITTINACLEIAPNAILVEKNDKIVIEVKDNSDITILKLLQNMVNMLKSLEEQYPKNIKFQ